MLRTAKTPPNCNATVASRTMNLFLSEKSMMPLSINQRRRRAVPPHFLLSDSYSRLFALMLQPLPFLPVLFGHLAVLDAGRGHEVHPAFRAFARLVRHHVGMDRHRAGVERRRNRG